MKGSGRVISGSSQWVNASHLFNDSGAGGILFQINWKSQGFFFLKKNSTNLFFLCLQMVYKCVHVHMWGVICAGAFAHGCMCAWRLEANIGKFLEFFEIQDRFLGILSTLSQAISPLPPKMQSLTFQIMWPLNLFWGSPVSAFWILELWGHAVSTWHLYGF